MIAKVAPMPTRRYLGCMNALALLALPIVLAGCSPQESPNGASTGRGPGAAASHATHAHADTPGIQWFDGSVEQAFEAARSSRKPILLYWGAVWCPPCQQLKATVFSRPEFIAKSRLFVPVYLDGDGEGAQKWGEQFRVSGYPTVVVLDADRHELMRIAGGMDLSLYATVLDNALADLQPVAELLAQVGAGKPLDESRCRRLALNSWLLDELPPEDQIAARSRQLATAAASCPSSLATERARLVVVSAALLAKSEGKALKQGAAPSAALQASVAAVGQVLADERRSVAVADVLFSLGDDFFLAVKASRDSAKWLASYVRTMDAVAVEPAYAEADQLAAIWAKLHALKAAGAATPGGAVRGATARIDAALAGQQTPYVRTSIVNSVLNIYDVLGQNERAYAVAKEEMQHSATPYYYMGDLGDICESLGRKEEALDWYARGYEGAQGTATRFQWGEQYAAALVELRPGDAETIGKVTAQVLGELDGPDRIYRRARIRLERLDKALRGWNEASKGAHAPVLASLRGRMQQVCARIPPAEPARGSCDAFLAGS